MNTPNDEYRIVFNILDSIGQLLHAMDGKERCPLCNRYGDHLENCLSQELNRIKEKGGGE